MSIQERTKYFLLGAGAMLFLGLMLGATTGSEPGKYQIACSSTGAFVMDTATGAVKVVWLEGGGSQLEKPFAAAKASPQLP